MDKRILLDVSQKIEQIKNYTKFYFKREGVF